MSALDSRLNAYRTDLADVRLKGIIDASRYAEGDLRQIAIPVAPVHREPQSDSMQTTQALMGERCRLFDSREGWAWVQLETDGYVGYIAEGSLSSEIASPSHRVAVPLSFIYPAANLKTQPAIPVPMNARLAVAGHDGKFAKLATGGFVFASHLKPIGETASDFVAVAEQFRHVPYLWGGKSASGIDCSGLVQLSLEAAGIACPRDTDMQERALGQSLLVNDLDTLRRGDLVFWSGHVGIMASSSDLVHANGHHMLTVREPLRDAVARIKANFGEVTSIKRL